MTKETRPVVSQSRLFLLSNATQMLELGLLGGGADKIGRDWLDARRGGRIDLVDDGVAGGDALIRRRAIRHRGIESTKADRFERLERLEEAIAGDVFVVQRLLQDVIGDI